MIRTLIAPPLLLLAACATTKPSVYLPPTPAAGGCSMQCEALMDTCVGSKGADCNGQNQKCLLACPGASRAGSEKARFDTECSDNCQQMLEHFHLLERFLECFTKCHASGQRIYKEGCDKGYKKACESLDAEPPPPSANESFQFTVPAGNRP